MKNGWEMKTLGDIMLVERGGSPRPIQKYLTDDPDGLNWIKISDATASTKYIYKTKEKITRAGLNKTREVNEGDFLLSNSMSFGRPYIMKTSGCIHDGWLVLRDKKTVQLDQDFLYYTLSSANIFQQFDALAAGSTVRNLNIGLVSSVKIPVPPIEEQRRIVAMLDEAFACIDKAKANTEKNIQNARELFDSYLNNIFSNPGPDWERVTLPEIATNLDSLRRPVTKRDRTMGEYPYYGASGIVDYVGDYIFDEDLLLVSEDGANLVARTYPIAFSISGKAWVNNHAHVVRFSNRPTQRLVEVYLNSISLLDYISGMAQPKLNQAMLNKIPIPLPPQAAQKDIFSRIEKLESITASLAETYSRKRVKLEETKKIILQKAFTGELMAKDVSASAV